MFAKRLKELRESADSISQKSFADIIGVAQSTYALYETEKREPSIETLCKIADYFNVTLDYLLGRSDSKTGNDDSTLRATGLNDEALMVFLQNIRDKDTLNKIITHDDFPLMVNLVSLYVNTDEHRLLAHIRNDEFNKLTLNECENALLKAYTSSHTQEINKSSKWLPPLLNVETIQFLRILTQHEPLEPFLLSVLDNGLNKIIADIKKMNSFERDNPFKMWSDKEQSKKIREKQQVQDESMSKHFTFGKSSGKDKK